MTYKFEQFNTEITNPTITINMENIVDNAISKMLTVEITLQTENAKMYGVSLNNIPYVETWEDSEIEAMVLIRLNDFIV